MLVYCPEPTPRLAYVLDFISEEMLMEKAVICQDINTFLHFEGVRINYSLHDFEGRYHTIRPHSLLQETGIAVQEIKMGRWKNLPVLFYREQTGLSFDLFAAIFYLLSRYEEYLPHEKDEFGRFSHEASLAYREGFLDRPLVNEWLMAWKEELSAIFPTAVFKRRSYRFIPTYDIDMLYCYRGKGWLRNLGGTARSLLQGDFKQAVERWQVLRGKMKDPFDAYEWLDALHLYCRVNPIYFFLVAQKPVGLDKNISTSYKPFQDLIKYYASVYKIGLHPSWQSSLEDDNTILREEKEWLEAVSDISVEKSRQHFIKFSLPGCYQRLLDTGIQKDYSMGYGTINGFRASVASSFYWFNLCNNATTALRIYPFCFMEVNSLFRQKQTPQQAYTELMKYYVAVKKVQGIFITIWHNNYLGSDPRYTGWRDLYELFMKEDAYWDAVG